MNKLWSPNGWTARFARHTAGATAIIYALTLAPLVTVIAMSVDLERANSAKVSTAAAADAASLMGARLLQDASNSDADIKTRVEAYFDAALAQATHPTSCAPPAITIDHTAHTVKLAADCTIGTVFGGFLGADTMAMKAHAVSKANLSKLDLALMLDVSGSMAGAKLDDLQTAAKTAIDTLITAETGNRVRIGFNSYADAVNVGAFAGDVFGPSWRPGDPTCATERNGFAAADDLEPGPGAWIGRDAGWACPGSTVEPLTSNGDHLKSAIDGLSANSMTAGHLGVAWAWYLIAPDWDDVWPSPSDPLAYSEPDSFKAVILMTDGAFNTEYAPALGTSRQQAEALCAEMRDAGVLVYAIAFQAPPAGEAVLENCAGDPDFFFSAEDGDDLVAAYDEIANQLSSLRIVE